MVWLEFFNLSLGKTVTNLILQLLVYKSSHSRSIISLMILALKISVFYQCLCAALCQSKNTREVLALHS